MVRTYEVHKKCLQGETPTLRFTITSDGAAYDVSSASLSLIAKDDPSDADGDAQFSKVHGDFNVSQAADGIVSVKLDADDTDTAGTYQCCLTIDFGSGTTVKKFQFQFEIEDAA